MVSKLKAGASLDLGRSFHAQGSRDGNPRNSSILNAKRWTIAVRPAKVWLTFADRWNCCDPVRINLPLLTPESTIPYRYESSPGARWISSRITPSLYRFRKLRESERANSLSWGFSKLTYSWFVNTILVSVVLPDCRGPVIVTTGNCPARDRSLSDNVLLIIPEVYQKIIYCQIESHSFN